MSNARCFEARPHPASFLVPALLLIAVLASAPGLAVAQQKAAAPQKQESVLATVATGQECLTCHENLTTAFDVSPHGKAARFLKGTEAPTCDTCHGDATKHNDSADPKDISSPSKMSAAQVSGMCLTCHARNQTHATWEGSAHDRSDMSCVSCHKVHHLSSTEKLRTRTGLAPTSLMQVQVSDKLLKQPGQELCLSCHMEKRKAILQRSTHLFATEHGETKVTCTSCHNPHGGEGKTMLVASSTTQLCYECHAERRGPFLWEHPPVREDCNICHVSHGSNNPSLLKSRPTFICQTCHMHTLWRHQNVAGFDILTFNHGCTNCHSQIHGSNHPSGKTFTH